MLIKYPNRRLYDTEKSRYMTLETIGARVMGGESVMAHATQRDITASILLGLIATDLEKGRAAPTAEALREFIRTYRAEIVPQQRAS